MPTAATTDTFLGTDLDYLQGTPRHRGRAQTLITSTTERQLRADLARLRTRLEVEFAARIRDARATGEAASGDDHLQIKEEELVIRAEIRRIETSLAGAVLVENQDPSARAAGIGSIVEVRDPEGESVRRHVITGDFDRGIAGEDLKPVSASSPVGHALLGRGPGERVEVELPNGRIRRLEIVSVSQPIHSPGSGTAQGSTNPRLIA